MLRLFILSSLVLLAGCNAQPSSEEDSSLLDTILRGNDEPSQETEVQPEYVPMSEGPSGPPDMFPEEEVESTSS